MKIDKQLQGAVMMVKPVGPVAGKEADQLKAHLLEERVKRLGRVVLDVSSVPFIDGRGLECLLEVSEEMSKSGQALRLCGANEVFRQVLELTDLWSFFEDFDDANSAVRSFL